MRLFGFLLGLVHDRDTDVEFEAELANHVEFDTEDGLRSGLSEAEARRRALIRLGGAEQTRQSYRERRTLPWIERLMQDVRFGLRMMARNRAFTSVAVLTLAVGIGASTAIFSAIKPILIDPLPYPHAGRLMMLWEMRKDGGPMFVTFCTFHGLAQRNGAFDALAVMRPWQPAMIPQGHADRPERFDGQRVSANYFRALGIEPLLGRDFQASDDRLRGPNVAILSDRLWKRRFAADAAIVGKQVRLDDSLYTVIGVMPAAFENLLAPEAQIWAPLQYDDSLPVDGREWGHHLRMVGRLRPGVTTAQARKELNAELYTLAQTFASGYNSSGGAPDGIVVNALQSDLTQGVRPALLAVLGAVTLVLLIACVNVANLLLARGSQRLAEFGLRGALGAGRSRLIRQLLTESLLLASLGGALGAAVSIAGVRALVALSPPGLPRVNAIGFDGGVFFFALAITTLIGIAAGWVQATQAERVDLRSALQQSSRLTAGGRAFTRRALVVTQVSIALVLLVSAGLLLRSMVRLFAVDPGFDHSHLLTMQVQGSARHFASNAAQLRAFAEALDAVRHVPGVVSAGFTTQLPLGGGNDVYGVRTERENNPIGDAALRYAVTPGYIETMRIPLLRGRLLDERDSAGAPVSVLINESLARRRFASLNPIGQRVRVGPDVTRSDRPWATIVGVVGNVKQQSLAIGDEDAFYVTTAQWDWLDSVQLLVVRTRGDAAALAPAVRDVIWSVDPNLPIERVATMDKLLAATADQRRFVLILFEAFGLVALTLAAIGIYGVLAGSVNERTREIGVRAALGATQANIVAMVMRQGMTMTVLGLAIGLCGALAAGRALATMLFSVSWFDGVTYGGATMLLLVFAGVACLIPARRAASIDPMQALRSE
jgi:putative ABC transport system permease protein